MAAPTSESSTSAGSLAELRDVAIASEPDRYFAATLAPAILRYDLIVLAAFAAEIARIPDLVREPLAGEIRLQWWRDALIGTSGEAAAGHPVAAAMRATIARFALATEVVEGVIDARADVLHGERPIDEAALRARLAAGEGGLFRLAARICATESADSDAINDAQTADIAGFAYGLSRELADAAASSVIPRSLVDDGELAAPGTSFSTALTTLGIRAREAHADVAARMRHMSRRRRLAFLPLVMVRPNLGALERENVQSAAPRSNATPIGRLLRIAWAHASGRV